MRLILVNFDGEKVKNNEGIIREWVDDTTHNKIVEKTDRNTS